MADLPTVSIIIPFFNDLNAVDKILPSLKNQSYPKEKYDIILVDNGSSKKCLDYVGRIVERESQIKLLRETNYLSSPYSARNRGVENSSGKILVFLDITNIPVEEWLNKGIEFMLETNSDLVGGAVEFSYSSKQTAGEIYDSLINIKMKESIEISGCAKTANLFVKRSVIEKFGAFKEGVRSGEDVRWTTEAVINGYTLRYCPASKVFKPARGLKELLIKQWRVSKNQPLIWKRTNIEYSSLKIFFRLFRPIGFSMINNMISNRGKPYFRKKIIQLWLIANLIDNWMALGNLYGLYKNRRD